MANYDSIQLSIVTPEGIGYASNVDMVVIPGSEGLLGILPNHTPLFTAVVPGELKVTKGDEEIPMAVAGGFADILPDRVTILTDLVVRAQDIDVLKAEEAKREAEHAMKERASDRDFAIAEASLKRALMELKVARKYRKQREA